MPSTNRGAPALFSCAELELLISGMAEVDVADWKLHTVYSPDEDSAGVAASELVGWFWEFVEELTPELKSQLLQFCTGSSRVPAGGFKALEAGFGERHLFEIRRTALEMAGELPHAHTCFNRIDLPNYSSKEEMAKSVLLALTHCAEGFQIE